MPGAGTKFTIQLPLTLAIISALMVEVGGRHLRDPAGLGGGEPASSVRRRSRASTAARPCASATASCPCSTWPGSSAMRSAGRAGAQAYAVILGRGEKRLGLVVDRLHGQQEVVIKALDPVGLRARRSASPGPPSWATAGWC